MNFSVFLLLFVVIFVLIAVVAWVLKAAYEEKLTQTEVDDDILHSLPDEPDEAMQWLEELTRRQEGSGTRRLH